jgi:O-antigen ligase
MTPPALPAGPSLLRPTRIRSTPARWERLVTVVAGIACAAGGLLAPTTTGPLLLVGTVGTAAVVLALVAPAAAVVLLLTTSFLRTAVHGVDLGVPLPGLLLAVALLGLVVAVARGALVLPRLGAPELVMGLYVVLNAVSWLAPHQLPVTTLYGTPPSASSLVVFGVAFPLTAYVVGRLGAGDRRVAPTVRWWIVVVTGYSALTAVLQFHGPVALVWPRYIVEAPTWTGRAVGIFNQPVTNGVLLVVGLVVCLWLGGDASRPRARRWIAHLVAAGAVYGIYLTHTRAIWLAMVLVLITAPLVSRVYRRGAFTILGLGAVAVVVNWAAITASDSPAGAVGSTDHVDDRLNMIATAIPAIRSEPLLGWGIGRFPAVNTVYHEQWSATTSWRNGYGFAAHETELAVGVELGLIGLALWLAVLVLLGRRVLAAHRAGADPGAPGIALLSGLVLIVVGTTVDLRLVDFAPTLVLLLAGLAVGPGRPPSPPTPVATERPGEVARP